MKYHPMKRSFNKLPSAQAYSALVSAKFVSAECAPMNDRERNGATTWPVVVLTNPVLVPDLVSSGF